MSRALKLKAKDAQALKDFLQKLRSALGHKVIEVKLFGSKAWAVLTATSRKAERIRESN